MRREGPSQTSNNGCHARGGARSARFSPDGTRILLPYLDGGLYVLDALDLARPKTIGTWTYPNDWNVEGQGAYVAPADIAGTSVGCVDLAIAMDLKYQGQIYRQPGGKVTAELAYVGR